MTQELQCCGDGKEGFIKPQLDKDENLRIVLAAEFNPDKYKAMRPGLGDIKWNAQRHLGVKLIIH